MTRVNKFDHPGWLPRVLDEMRILIIGGSGGLGKALIKMLLDGSQCIVGAHGATQDVEADDERLFRSAALSNRRRIAMLW